MTDSESRTDKALSSAVWTMAASAGIPVARRAEFVEMGVRLIKAELAALPAGVGGDREALRRAEYARLLGVQDIAQLIVDGWDHGFPVSDGAGERDLVDRLRAGLAKPATDHP